MLSSKVVLITGASSGIGAATAVKFASEGAKLALTGRNLENLQATAQKCQEKSNLKPLIIKADLNLDGDVRKIMETTMKTYERLDILINNAGIFFVSNPEDGNMEMYDKIFSTNVSLAGLRPFAQFIPYSMSKAALDHFTRCLALQLAPKQTLIFKLYLRNLRSLICWEGLERWKKQQKKEKIEDN
ncbi:short chain dehydrogenase [Popillia japonica]|uniref:Short chain dehydrogenase n=1 Tax=Popillia japonica TaxID=7064 RepID=A0AAW1J0C1_POPJA